MSKFKLSPDFVNASENNIVDAIKKVLWSISIIYSINGKEYEINEVNSFAIYYTGKNRNEGNPELILFEDIKIVFRSIKGLGSFNTNSIKEEIPTSIYRKRSPLFAILLGADIIVKE